MTDAELDAVVAAGIETYWAKHFNAPTLRELMILIGQPSFKKVHLSLTRLREAGIVHWNERQSRTLRVVANEAGEKQSVGRISEHQQSSRSGTSSA